MRLILLGIIMSSVSAAMAQTTLPSNAGPADEKAQKTYQKAQEWLKHHNEAAALGFFKKDDKEDSGHCRACQKEIIELGEKAGDFKAADMAADEMLAEAQSPAETADAHLQRGVLLLHEALRKGKDDKFAEADKEFKNVLAINPKYSLA